MKSRAFSSKAAGNGSVTVDLEKRTERDVRRSVTAADREHVDVALAKVLGNVPEFVDGSHGPNDAVAAEIASETSLRGGIARVTAALGIED